MKKRGDKKRNNKSIQQVMYKDLDFIQSETPEDLLRKVGGVATNSSERNRNPLDSSHGIPSTLSPGLLGHSASSLGSAVPPAAGTPPDISTLQHEASVLEKAGLSDLATADTSHEAAARADYKQAAEDYAQAGDFKDAGAAFNTEAGIQGAENSRVDYANAGQAFEQAHEYNKAAEAYSNAINFATNSLGDMEADAARAYAEAGNSAQSLAFEKNAADDYNTEGNYSKAASIDKDIAAHYATANDTVRATAYDNLAANNYETADDYVDGAHERLAAAQAYGADTNDSEQAYLAAAQDFQQAASMDKLGVEAAKHLDEAAKAYTDAGGNFSQEAQTLEQTANQDLNNWSNNPDILKASADILAAEKIENSGQPLNYSSDLGIAENLRNAATAYAQEGDLKDAANYDGQAAAFFGAGNDLSDAGSAWEAKASDQFKVDGSLKNEALNLENAGLDFNSTGNTKEAKIDLQSAENDFATAEGKYSIDAVRAEQEFENAGLNSSQLDLKQANTDLEAGNFGAAGEQFAAGGDSKDAIAAFEKQAQVDLQGNDAVAAKQDYISALNLISGEAASTDKGEALGQIQMQEAEATLKDGTSLYGLNSKSALYGAAASQFNYSAHDLANAAQAYMEEAKVDQEIGQKEGSTSSTTAEASNEFISTINELTSAAQSFVQSGDEKDAAKAYSELAQLVPEQLQMAQNSGQGSNTKAGDKTSAQYDDQAAQAFTKAGDLADAAKAYDQEAQAYQAAGDQADMLSAYISEATTYNGQAKAEAAAGHYNQAGAAYNDAAQSLNKAEESAQAQTAVENAGSAYAEAGKTEEAQDKMQDAANSYALAAAAEQKSGDAELAAHDLSKEGNDANSFGTSGAQQAAAAYQGAINEFEKVSNLDIQDETTIAQVEKNLAAIYSDKSDSDLFDQTLAAQALDGEATAITRGGAGGMSQLGKAAQLYEQSAQDYQSEGASGNAQSELERAANTWQSAGQQKGSDAATDLANAATDFAKAGDQNNEAAAIEAANQAGDQSFISEGQSLEAKAETLQSQGKLNEAAQDFSLAGMYLNGVAADQNEATSDFEKAGNDYQQIAAKEEAPLLNTNANLSQQAASNDASSSGQAYAQAAQNFKDADDIRNEAANLVSEANAFNQAAVGTTETKEATAAEVAAGGLYMTIGQEDRTAGNLGEAASEFAQAGSSYLAGNNNLASKAFVQEGKTLESAGDLLGAGKAFVQAGEDTSGASGAEFLERAARDFQSANDSKDAATTYDNVANRYWSEAGTLQANGQELTAAADDAKAATDFTNAMNAYGSGNTIAEAGEAMNAAQAYKDEERAYEADAKQDPSNAKTDLIAANLAHIEAADLAQQAYNLLDPSLNPIAKFAYAANDEIMAQWQAAKAAYEKWGENPVQANYQQVLSELRNVYIEFHTKEAELIENAEAIKEAEEIEQASGDSGSVWGKIDGVLNKMADGIDDACDAIKNEMSDLGEDTAEWVEVNAEDVAADLSELPEEIDD